MVSSLSHCFHCEACLRVIKLGPPARPSPANVSHLEVDCELKTGLFSVSDGGVDYAARGEGAAAVSHDLKTFSL